VTLPSPASQNIRAIVAMVASMLIFSISDVLMKIIGARMPVGQMMLVRGLIATALILGLAQAMGVLGQARLMLHPKVLARSLAEAICSVLYFVALLRMTLSDVAAISQFGPLAVMAGAALLLGEQVGWRRWTAAAVGFLGVLLIVKPGTSAFQPASLIMLASMLFVAIRDLFTRRLPAGMPTVLVTAGAIIAVTLTGAAMAPFETWHWPSVLEWLLLCLTGVAVISGFMLGIAAMRSADIAVVSPFRYSFVVFATALGFFVFGETTDALAVAGVTLIIASGLYSLHRERIRRSEARG
jgi:drug/metabolite transporter (DMT)-like permease